jgi:hypothetical protein
MICSQEILIFLYLERIMYAFAVLSSTDRRLTFE